MDYLEDIFKEELSDEDNVRVENGRVYIRSRHWSPIDIVEMARLPDGKNVLFDELFAEWLEERTENKLSEANEILEKYDQGDRFLKLSEEFNKGSVIPFVGAGMSVPSGYPGWTNYLRKQLVNTTISRQEFEALIDGGLYEEAAQQIADELGVGFSEAVDSAFGCSRDLAGCVRMLPYVFPGSVVTTNFDNVLERSYTDAGRPFSAIMSGQDSASLRKNLAANNKLLIMLHGKVTSGEGRILTKDEYDEHYSHNNILEKVIKSLCDRNNLLFLGCGLTVDRTLTCLKEYVNEEGHENLPKHYAFLEDPDNDALRIQRQRQLSECHIYPIWYPKDMHDESIEALLIKLRGSIR